MGALRSAKVQGPLSPTSAVSLDAIRVRRIALEAALAEAHAAAGPETRARIVGLLARLQALAMREALSRGEAPSFDEESDRLFAEQGIVRTDRSQRRADETTDLALEWLAGRGEQPFLLWLHYFDPHDPVVLPPQSRR